MFNIGKNLRIIRKSQGLTIKELAEKSGVSVSYISQLEKKGRSEPSARVLYSLSRALNKDMKDLLGILESSQKRGYGAPSYSPWLLEVVAAKQHEIWAHWQRYLHDKCEMTEIGLLIPPELVNRWDRQIRTAYADLSETEKESDREQARKIILAVGEFLSKGVVQ